MISIEEPSADQLERVLGEHYSDYMTYGIYMDDSRGQLSKEELQDIYKPGAVILKSMLSEGALLWLRSVRYKNTPLIVAFNEREKTWVTFTTLGTSMLTSILEGSRTVCFYYDEVIGVDTAKEREVACDDGVHYKFIQGTDKERLVLGLSYRAVNCFTLEQITVLEEQLIRGGYDITRVRKKADDVLYFHVAIRS